MNSFLLLGFWLLGVARASQDDEQFRPTGDYGVRTNWLEESLVGLEKAIDFFEKNYYQINLDGIFGLRVAQGQLQQALSFLTSLNDVPQEVVNRVETLAAKAGRSADDALPYLEAKNRRYFEQFKKLVTLKFDVPYIPRQAQDIGLSKDDRVAIYDEPIGDACFMQMMGNRVPPRFRDILGDYTPRRCTLSPVCMKIMLENSEKKRSYALTHQLLFLIQAKRFGCPEASKYIIPTREDPTREDPTREDTTRPRNNQNFRNSQAETKDPEQYLCNQIYSEFLQNVQSSHMKTDSVYQDLFFEQSCLCGMLGFENFLRPQFLRMVLSWQNHEGCFALMKPENFSQPKRSSRRLLVEDKLPGGCLSHKSGLGVATLGLYVRYLVEHGQELNYY